MNFAPAFEASAAWPISLVFGTLRHGAQEGDIEKAAVAAIHTIKKCYLVDMFYTPKSRFEFRRTIDKPGDGSEGLEESAFRVEKGNMGQPGE